jgi:Tol biopolymer transport system component/DNA-binding winged helix-turn-helix (wHTH) protein
MAPDSDKSVFEFDEFRLDTRKRQLTRAGEVVPLYSKAFDLLVALAQNGGRDLTKEELFETVWPGQILEDANLTVTMSAVRKALGERAVTPRYIVTIPGHGYRFVADISKADGLIIETETISQITVDQETGDDVVDVPPGSPKQIEPRDPKQLNSAPVPAPQRWPIIAGVVLTILLLAGMAFYLLRSRSANASTNRFAQIKIVQVTSTGRVVNAALSPNGKTFGFVQIDQERDLQTLRLGQMNGDKDIELVPPAAARYQGLEYSNDGASLYYARQEAGEQNFALYRISAIGGAPVKLRDNIYQYFSLTPDEKRVIFTRGADNGRSLIVSNVDGSNESALVTLGPERRLSSATASSPDGSAIAVSATADGKGEGVAVFLLPAKGGEMKRLTDALWRDITRIVWLKDGSGLLLLATGLDQQEIKQVWFVDFPSGKARRITNELAIYDIGLTVGGDPNSFLLVQQKQLSNLWIAPAGDLSHAKQLTFTGPNLHFGTFAFDWLPDGRIVHSFPTGRGLGLSVMNADGKDVKELTPPGNGDGIPSVTADGKYLVFQSSRSGSDQIWRADTNGGNARQLTTCGNNSQSAVSPDGKWVVYLSDCEGQSALWRISIDGDKAVRLTDRAVNWPWFSPDSRWIAGAYRSDAGKIQLAIFSIEGGVPARLFDPAPRAIFNFGIRWTPDGKAIAYRESGFGLWRQSIEGGPPQRIGGLPEEKIGCFGWSRDGKLFVFGRNTEYRDIVMISGANQ